MEIKLDFEGFEGSVTMRVAKNSERMRVFGALGLNLNNLSADNFEQSFNNFEMQFSPQEKSRFLTGSTETWLYYAKFCLYQTLSREKKPVRIFLVFCRKTKNESMNGLY